MGKHELYAKALEALQTDEPCEAANCIFEIESHSENPEADSKFKILKKECLEQLYFLSKENLENGNLEEIDEWINSYTLLQDDERIRNIRAKLYMAKQEAKKRKEEVKSIPVVIPSSNEQEQKTTPKQKISVEWIFPVSLFLLVIAAISIWTMTRRDYAYELELFQKECIAKGNSIIAISQSNHLILYIDSNALWLNNLDEPAKKILTPDKKMKAKKYIIEWEKDKGKPFIDSWIYETELGTGFFDENISLAGEVGYITPLSKYNSSLLNAETLSFKHKELIDNRGEIEELERNYIYFLSSPDSLLVTQNFQQFSYGSRIETLESYAGYLADAVLPAFDEEDIFPYRYGYNIAEGGSFKWDIYIDSVGVVTGHESKIRYENEMYDLRTEFSLSDFSTKEKCIDLLRLIKYNVEEIKIKRFMSELSQKAISPNDMGKEYANNAFADGEYKNRDLIIQCKLEKLDKTEPGLNFKYKLTTEYARWFSYSNDITAYSNDDNFLNLQYPIEVYMKARLHYGSETRFIFTNCELLAIKPKEN